MDPNVVETELRFCFNTVDGATRDGVVATLRGGTDLRMALDAQRSDERNEASWKDAGTLDWNLLPADTVDTQSGMSVDVETFPTSPWQ